MNNLIFKTMKRKTLLFLFFVFLFATFNSFYSCAFLDVATSESSLVSQNFSKSPNKKILLASRESSYPKNNTFCMNEVAFDLNIYYGNGQKNFYCAYPSEEYSPFSYIGKNGTSPISVPFLALPVSLNTKPATVSFLADPMFGNSELSTEIPEHSLFITQDMANTLLGSDPSEDDYRSLKGCEFNAFVSLGGKKTSTTFIVSDILTKGSYDWLIPFYGNCFVVGGYAFRLKNILDGFEINTILQNDFYSNQHFLRAYSKIILDKYKFNGFFFGCENGNRTDLQITEKAQKIVAICAKIKAWSVILSFLFVFLAFFVLKTKPNCPIWAGQTYQKIVLLLLSFAISQTICNYIRPWIPPEFVPISSSPTGFLASLVFLFILIFLCIKKPDVNRSKTHS